MGYIYLIGGKRGYVVAHSTTDTPFGQIFPSYEEARHFVGYWLTHHSKPMKGDQDYWEALKEWNEKYFQDDGETFVGKSEDFDYERLSYDDLPKSAFE